MLLHQRKATAFEDIRNRFVFKNGVNQWFHVKAPRNHVWNISMS